MMSRRWFSYFWLLLATGAIFAEGCSRAEIEKVPVQGTVTVGGTKPDSGIIRFIPIDHTHGPISMSFIEDGYFHIENRGGVPVGKHRIEVIASRKTGRQISMPRDGGMIDDLKQITPEEYGGEHSPLSMEISQAQDDLRIYVPEVSRDQQKH